jgi:hypothetical protein
MNTAYDDELTAENMAHLEAEVARNARLRQIIGLSEIDNDDDEEAAGARGRADDDRGAGEHAADWRRGDGAP